MVTHNRISECVEMIRITEDITKFMSDSMRPWKLGLTSFGESL